MENIKNIQSLIEKKVDFDITKWGQNQRLKLKQASKFIWDDPKKADGIPILARTSVSDSDPNIKLSYDLFSLIANEKAGYLGGDITRIFTDEIKDDVKNKYQEFDRLNNTKSFLKNLMETTSAIGIDCTLNFISEDKKQVYIKEIKPYNCLFIKDKKTEETLQGVIYSFKKEEKTNKKIIDKIWVYDDTNVKEYSSEKGKLKLVSTQIHGFKKNPLIEWKNNNKSIGNSEKAISLLDAWDRLTSDNATEWATFRNAYLMLKNMGVVDEEIKNRMQKTGVVIADSENSEVKFITKDVNPEFSKLVLETIWNGIWIVSSSVDPKALSTLSNATAFQINQLYRKAENDAKNTEMEWKISLQKLDEILKSFWTGLDVQSISNYDTYEVNYEFPRNRPKDEMADLESMLRAGGRLPQKEIFRRSGYSEKISEELAKEAEKEIEDSLPEIE